MNGVRRYFHDRPWLWIAIGFCLMLAGLATVVVIAEKNKPAAVPLRRLQ